MDTTYAFLNAIRDIALYWLGAHGAGEETCMSPFSSLASDTVCPISAEPTQPPLEGKGINRQDPKRTKHFLKLRTSEADKVRCGQTHVETLGDPFSVVVSAYDVWFQ